MHLIIEIQYVFYITICTAVFSNNSFLLKMEKEREISYLKMKRSPEERHTQTHTLRYKLFPNLFQSYLKKKTWKRRFQKIYIMKEDRKKNVLYS